jgi:hypothetical protein
MDGIDLAKKIVSEVNKKIKRVYWTNEQIDDLFGKRSAKDIIKDGTTCFMNPCLDLTLVSSYLMSSKKIIHKFVIEEHLPTKDFNFNRLHFAIEFQHENKDYTLNYKKENEVYIYEGNYNGREDIPREKIIRIPGEKISPGKSLNKSLGYNTLEDLLRGIFSNYSLEKNIARLKKDNSKKNYEFYKEKFGKEFNIITKLENQS